MIVKSIQNFGLEKGQKIICAVSGGVDSMVLLDALCKTGFEVIVAHFNHQVRSESEHEALWLEKETQARGLVFEIKKLELDPSKNMHHQAHWKRIEFYLHLSKKYNTNIVFLAHHLNDQLEQFLMKLIRGDQPYAWSGMKKIRSFLTLKLYRPFLDIPKSNLIEYAKEKGLDYVEDPSNQSLKYFRNQIRHLVIPKLLQENANLLEDLPKLFMLFDKTFKCDFQIYHKMGFYYIDERFFRLQKPIHQAYILHVLSKRIKHDSHFTQKHIEMMLSRLSKDSSSVRFEISKNVYLIRQYQMIGIYQKTDSLLTPILIQDFGSFPLNSYSRVIVSREKIRHLHVNAVELCYNKITFPITIRTPQKGDLMRFSFGHKKLKKIFLDHKTPYPFRSKSYVVETQEGIQGILSESLSNDVPCDMPKIYIYEVSNVA
jgi:tRNA(Ile)-lysidine synthetase-like protein